MFFLSMIFTAGSGYNTTTKSLTAYCDWRLDSKGKQLSLTYSDYLVFFLLFINLRTMNLMNLTTSAISATTRDRIQP